ncbi:MAG: type II toxin-antitoxin system HicA family toxin [Boseongicola sp. SB0664_bin_43]|uniref:Type II toxin-antitoxin system HicA family toxin n=1 Tax=Boseongicola sp. SB0664_bin_43 TaxID=2604844 RepID=A0A6B0XZR2_9RHOB|nr:type II toxin-antitoxin system HicA family toxin [Boseongicola sp. SB0664_bin_43]MYK31115.1 type II toxin-antitoxin system HicA family toxin [Boseongicola sp. SB0670_bin_30]
MSQREKLIERFKTRPKDFSWDELTRLLESLGYRQASSGKTTGSRRRFVHETAPTINLHAPHPGKIVRAYVVRNVLEVLTRERLL